MSSFWWMKPGWKSTVCSCGANIWESGGDPDHGVCYDCFSHPSASTHELDHEAEYDAYCRDQHRHAVEEYLEAGGIILPTERAKVFAGEQK
jgi:hypothetical protein